MGSGWRLAVGANRGKIDTVGLRGVSVRREVIGLLVFALALLAGNPGKVFDRDQILQALRGIDCDAFNRSVDITMSRLRQKLNDNPKKPAFIKTVWGTGYVFIGEPTGDAKKLAE